MKKEEQVDRLLANGLISKTAEATVFQANQGTSEDTLSLEKPQEGNISLYKSREPMYYRERCIGCSRPVIGSIRVDGLWWLVCSLEQKAYRGLESRTLKDLLRS